MLVLAMLVFLALVALERINSETTKLVRKLDLVGIEVSRTSTVAQTARERLELDALRDDRLDAEYEASLARRLEKQVVIQHAEREGEALGEADRNMVREMASIKLLLKAESA